MIFLFTSLFIFYFTNSYRRAHDHYRYTSTGLFFDIYFANEDDGWLVGVYGTISITHDGGQSWERHYLGGNPTLRQIQFVSEQVGWVRGLGEIYKSTDGGLTWNLQTDALDYVESFYFVNETMGWAITSWIIYSLLITRDGGNSWSPQITLPNLAFPAWNALRDVSFINESHGWVLSQGGISGSNFSTTILHTNNSGESWETYSSTINMSANKIYFKDHLNGWAFGAPGALFHTNDSGITWSNQSSYTEETLQDIYFLNGSIGWICGTNGTILYTENGGVNWTNYSSSSLEMDLNAIYFHDEIKGWAVPSNPGILQSHDGGNQWQYYYYLYPFFFSNSWIWVLITADTVLMIAGTWSVKNFKKIKRTRMVQKIKGALNTFEASIFNVKNTFNRVTSIFILLGLFYGLGLFSTLIHESGHAFASLLAGGFTDHIEVNLNLSGLAYTRFPPLSPSYILCYTSGLLAEVIIGISLMALCFKIKRNRRFFFAIALIISYVFIINPLINFIFVPYFIFYCDASLLALYIGVPLSLISLIFIPFFIISIIITGIIIDKFYKTHLDSRRGFLFIFLISFLFYFGLTFLFSATGAIFTIILS